MQELAAAQHAGAVLVPREATTSTSSPAAEGGYKQQNKQPNQAGKPDQAGLFGQVCYIHLKYGNKAYSCVDSNTCDWSGKE